MIILFFLLISFNTLFTSYSAQLIQASPHKNFAVDTDGIISNNGIGNASQLHYIPYTNYLVGIYDEYNGAGGDSPLHFVKINTITGAYNAPTINNTYVYHAIPYGPYQIYWDNSNFVVPVNTDVCNYRGYLSRYDYDLDLDASFGTAGITDAAILNSIFITVTKHNNKYYVGGQKDTMQAEGLIYRYNLDGTVDTTFNNPNGYIELDHQAAITQILPLKDFLVIKKNIPATGFTKLATLSYESPYNISDTDDVIMGNISVCSSLVKYDDYSFFGADGSSLRKYKVSDDGMISRDTSFNIASGSGTLTNIDANLIFQYLLKINNYLFIGGYEQSDEKYPKILCYNISNMAHPVLETSFYNNGLWSAAEQHEMYPDGDFGIQSMTFTTDSAIPSIFFSGDKRIVRVGITNEKLVKNSSPQTITSRVLLLDALNKKIPFLGK